MHVHVYKLKLEPTLWHVLQLTPELLAGRLPGDAVIQEFTPQHSGSQLANVALQRDRDSHEEALNEVLIAAQEIGYGFVEAEITRIADRAIEMACGLGVGGFGAGATTENGELALIGAGIGWVVGLLVGANMKKVEVVYRAQLTSTGWHLTPIAPQPAPFRPALQTS